MPSRIRQQLGLTDAAAKPKGMIREDLQLKGQGVPGPSAEPSGFKTWAVDMYRKGRLHSSEVGECAAAALEAGASSTAVEALAKARAPPDKVCRKRSLAAIPDSRNSARALHRVLAADTVAGPTYTAEVSSWDHVREQRCTRPVAFLPVHEMLQVVVPEGQEAAWCASEGQQEGFGQARDDWGTKLGLQAAELALCVGIALWGDSAPFTRKDSLYLLLWTCLTGPSRRRHPICAFNKKVLCKCGCLGRHTMDDLFAVISWMFRALLARCYPFVDHLGRPFKKGSYRHQLAQLGQMRLGGGCIMKCGDWAWFKSSLGLRGWNGDKGTGKKSAGCARPPSTMQAASTAVPKLRGGEHWCQCRSSGPV